MSGNNVLALSESVYWTPFCVWVSNYNDDEDTVSEPDNNVHLAAGRLWVFSVAWVKMVVFSADRKLKKKQRPH